MNSPIGARRDPATGLWNFRVWAPLKKKIELSLLLPDKRRRIIPMRKDAMGYWSASIAVKSGTRYMYRIDDKIERPDPASFFQPEGVHSPSETFDAGAPDRMKSSAQKNVRRETGDMIISEIHIGAFTREGTFEAAAKRLKKLKDSGINTVEIMPVSQFPGKRNWGYDGAYPFAVQNSYGGPAGLKFFVEECHKRGISVILDVVYNHLGPEGNYLGEFAPYFTDKYHTPWGRAVNFDDKYSRGVRDYFIANAVYWFENFNVDALRLDAIHGIFDEGPVHILDELSRETARLGRRLGRKFRLIAESDLNDSRVVRSRKEGGYAIDAQWSDDYHHAIHTLLTQERSGYYADFGKVSDFVKAYLKGVVYDGRYSRRRRKIHGNSYDGVPAKRFVVCAQNHDQVGNRMFAERLAAITDFESLKLACACVMLSPFIPLFFMGDEYGEDAPFGYFIDHGDPALVEAVRKGRAAEFASFGWKTAPSDPAAPETFEKSRTHPESKNAPRNRAMSAYFLKLAKLRTKLPELSVNFDTVANVSSDDGLVIVRRKKGRRESVIFFNFSKNPSVFDKIKPSRLIKILDSSDDKWLGPGILSAAQGEIITINPRSVAVYELTK